MSKNSVIQTYQASKEWALFLEQDRKKRGISPRKKKKTSNRKDYDEFDEYDLDELFGKGSSSNFSSKKRKK